MAKPITYFHVGYAQVASTFLQKTVFPALIGLQYIPHGNFSVCEFEKKRFKKDKVLMSCEAGESIFDRCDRVWEIFQSKIIVSVCRHDKLAESSYRLYVQNGHTFGFADLLDVKDDYGVRKIKDWTYLNVLEYAEKLTGEKPLLLILEDYVNDPDFYIDSLCAYLECGIDRAKLNRQPLDNIYPDKQLRMRRKFSQQFLSPQESKKRLMAAESKGYTTANSFKDKTLLKMSSGLTNLARFVPDSFVHSEPLFDDEHSKAITDFFAPDWSACFDYVEQQSERFGVSRNKAISWK